MHDGASAKLAEADQSDSGRHEPLMRAATEDCPAFDGFANELFVTEGAVSQENDLPIIQFPQEIRGTC